MDYKDVNLFTGTGLKEEEISKIIAAGDKDTKLKELRSCRLRILTEVHEKQQELDRLDFLLKKIREG